jgi:replicative DNA helicase
MVDTLASLHVPPHNIEAEKNVLAGIFVDPELLYVYDGFALNASDFYDQAHQHIYTAIKTLVAHHKPIDILTVTDQMAKDKTLDQSGGEDYVYSLPSYLVNIGACGDYAQIVKEKSILRQILKTCTKISADVFDQKDPRDIIDTIEKRIFDLTQLHMRTGLVHIKDVLDRRIDDYMELVDNPDLLDARKTFSQYHKLDEMLSGFKP